MEPEPTPLPPKPAPKSRGMPRPAIKAIAYSGLFCGATTAFLTWWAIKGSYHPFFIALNVFTTLFMVLGSVWMLYKLSKA